MQVHQVVYHTALKVIANLIDDDLFSNIDQLDVRESLFVLVDGLVDLLIVADAVTEVLGCYLGILILVVGRSCLDLQNIAHDDLLIIALGLNKHGMDVVGLALLVDPLAAGFGRIGSIQHGDDSFARVEPLDHVCHGGLSGCMTETLSFFVASVEELSRWIWSVVAAVRANVEDASRNRKPCEVADDY